VAFVPQASRTTITSINAEKSKSIPFLSAPSNLDGLIGNKGTSDLAQHLTTKP